MFNVQKSANSLEIYINYNEYIKKDEDESIPTLEQIFKEEGLKEFRGVIDLITVRKLSEDEEAKITQIYDVLKKGDIKELNVISDNRKVLEHMKEIMPDISVTLLRKG